MGKTARQKKVPFKPFFGIFRSRWRAWPSPTLRLVWSSSLSRDEQQYAQLPQDDAVCPWPAGRRADPGSDRPLLPAAGCPAATGQPQPCPLSGDGRPALQRRSDGPGQPLPHQPGSGLRQGCGQPAAAGQPASDPAAGERLQGRPPGTGSSPTCCCVPSPSSGRIPCKTTAMWYRSSRPPLSVAWRRACSRPLSAICCSAFCCCRFASASPGYATASADPSASPRQQQGGPRPPCCLLLSPTARRASAIR